MKTKQEEIKANLTELEKPKSKRKSKNTAASEAELVVASISQSQVTDETEAESVVANIPEPQLTGEPEAQAVPAIIPDPQLTDEPAVETNPVTILIPYLKSEADGEELKYAIRSWQKNFKSDFKIVVIGDREDWFSPEIVHIPHDPVLIKEDCDCPAPSLVRDPQVDVANKVFAFIAAGFGGEDFILTNDDIFLLGPTYIEDILILKAFGKLDQSGKEGGVYNKNAKRTAQALSINNLPTHRYGAHTPIVLNANKALDIIERYNALENGYLLSSLYFNTYNPEGRPLQVDGGASDPILASAYRSNISKEVLQRVFDTRKFLNCNSKGWLSVKELLEDNFPTPSIFEKI